MQRPARVTFVLPDFEAGGAQRVLLTIAGRLDRTRFTPSILVLDDRGAWRSLIAEDVAVSNLEQPRLRHALRSLRRELQRTAPDVIVSTIGYLNLGVLFSRLGLEGVKVIVRESNTPHRGARHFLVRMAQRWAYALLYRRADAVISPSRLIGDELIRDYHVPGHLVCIVHNPIDESALRAAASPPMRKIGEGARFVAVGRLSAQKGYDRMLETLSHVGEFHLTVFGEGEDRGALEAQSKMLGLANRVSFAGFEPNPAPWVAGADALLLGSRWEGLPNVALEALACGTPVIATPESGGIDEIARLAEPGAITLAPMGPDFLTAMTKSPRNDPARLRASLLPNEFRLEAVLAEFERLLDLVRTRNPARVWNRQFTP